MKRYYIFPIIYVLFVVASLANYSLGRKRMEFISGNLEARFVPTRDQVEKTQYTLPEDQRLSISSAQLSFRNITLYFSDNPKAEKNLVLESVSVVNSENIILFFKNDVTISFQSHRRFSEELIISMRSLDFFRYSIPISFALGYKLDPVSETLLKTSFGENTFHLYGTKRFTVTRKAPDRRYKLEVYTDTISLRYAKGSTTRFTFLDKVPLISPLSRKQYSEELASYLDKAYNGWLFGRYNTSDGSWLMPEGIFSFSEDIVMSLFSETLLRDDTDESYSQIIRSISKNPSGGSPNLDLILGHNRPALDYVEYSQSESQFLRAKISLGDSSVFTQHDVFSRLHSSSLDDLKIKMIQWLGTFSLEELSTLEVISLLYYGSLVQEWDELREFISQNRSYLELRFISQITKVDKGYFVVNGSSIDTKATILLGKYLTSFSQESNMIDFGYKMLVTTLGLANTLGYIPRFYVIKSLELLPRGVIPPEELYFLLQDKAIHAQLVTLDTQDEQGKSLPAVEEKRLKVFSYMKTSVDVLINSNEIVVSFVSPLNKRIPFYAYIWPLTSFENVEAFGEVQGLSLPVESTQQGLYHTQEDVLIYKTQSHDTTEVLRLRF